MEKRNLGAKPLNAGVLTIENMVMDQLTDQEHLLIQATGLASPPPSLWLGVFASLAREVERIFHEADRLPRELEALLDH